MKHINVGQDTNARHLSKPLPGPSRVFLAKQTAKASMLSCSHWKTLLGHGNPIRLEYQEYLTYKQVLALILGCDSSQRFQAVIPGCDSRLAPHWPPLMLTFLSGSHGTREM